MLKCGDYTLDRPVGWGRTATYYTAYAGEEAGEMRLVVRYSRSAERRHVQSFLKSAAEQQTAVSSGCRRVAPVLDFGVAETGHAYRVNLGSEISLAELIQAGNSVDHDYLRTIITGTLRGLTELRDKFKRPHGNLSAGNILLDRNGEVLLTDLSPSALEGRHSDDLRSLGAVIYQVVRQSLKIGFLSPPLERSPEWTNVLGDNADDWRELTNRLLLTKTGEGAASLERAVKELKSLASLGEQATVVPAAASSGPSGTVSGPQVATPALTPRKRKRRWRLAVAGLTVLGLGGVGSFLLRKDEKKVEEKLNQYVRPGLRDFQKLIPVASANQFEGGIITRLKERASTSREMWDLIAVEWQAPAELRKLQAEWQKPPRAWEKLAEEITPPAELPADPAAFSEEEQDKRLADALQKMEPTVKLLASAESLEKQWVRIDDLCQQVTGEKESARLGFPEFSEWARYFIRESGGLQKAEQRVALMNVGLRDVQKFLREDGSRVHGKLMQKSAASIPPFTDPAFQSGQLWPQRWVDDARKLLRPKPATLAGWETKFKVITSGIEDGPESAKVGLRLELEALRTASLDTLATGEADFEKRIDALRGKIKVPLEDLDNAFWARVQKFNLDLASAPTSDIAKAQLKAFTEEIGALFVMPEYVRVKDAFFSRNKIESLPALLKPFEAASLLRGQPSFAFKNRLASWTPTLSQDGTSVLLRAPADQGAHELSFQALPGTTAAMAATETSLALARLAAGGAPLETPGLGPLGFRDDPSKSGIQRWLWKTAEVWQRDMGRIGQNPATIIPTHPDVNSCPVTWVTGARAFQLAQALGARLPTSAEWTSAVSAQGSAGVRLRGAAFTKAQGAIDGFSSTQSTESIALDTGAFSFATDASAKWNQEDDPYPWFVPVVPTAAKVAAFGKFPHLIGNAAEWIMNPEGGKYVAYVAGGSCVTPRNAMVVTPSPAAMNRSYSDVTFRLVVDMAPGSPNAALDGIKLAAENLAKSRPARP